jgi:hypothetical protein
MSAMKRFNSINDNELERQIARTRKVWQPSFRDNLTDEGARQILLNVSGFFSLLAKWRENEMLSRASGHAAQTAPFALTTGEEVRHDVQD